VQDDENESLEITGVQDEENDSFHETTVVQDDNDNNHENYENDHKNYDSYNRPDNHENGSGDHLTMLNLMVQLLLVTSLVLETLPHSLMTTMNTWTWKQQMKQQLRTQVWRRCRCLRCTNNK